MPVVRTRFIGWAQRTGRALAAVLLIGGCALEPSPPPDEDDAFRAFEGSKADALADFLRFKSGDAELADALAAQYARERGALVAGLQAGRPNEELMTLVANSFVIRPGSGSVTLPDAAVSWLFIEDCALTEETFRAGDQRTGLALIGLGNQEIHTIGTAPEKRLDLALVEIPGGEEVTIATDSFSLLGKGAIVVGAGGIGLLLVTQCRAPAPAAKLVCRPRADRSACVLASGNCPAGTNCLVSAREGLDVIACRCQ